LSHYRCNSRACDVYRSWRTYNNINNNNMYRDDNNNNIRRRRAVGPVVVVFALVEKSGAGTKWKMIDDDDNDTVVSGGGARARCHLQGRRRRAPLPRPHRPADLPGASYFAPQGRHISRGTHEACCNCSCTHTCLRVQPGKLAAPDSSGIGTARAMTTRRHRRSVLEYTAVS